MLKQAKNEIEKKKRKYSNMAASLEETEGSETDLRDANIDIDKKLQEALDGKRKTEENAVSARTEAANQIDEVKK